MTKYTDIFCWKNEKSFSHFFIKKYQCIWDINIWNFNFLHERRIPFPLGQVLDMFAIGMDLVGWLFWV